MSQWFALALLLLGSVLPGQAGTFLLNELFFNPPGVDAPYEYIEIRGIPNSIFPKGSYLLGIEGDGGNNPGTIQDIFDLSGQVIGGNGFLVLLQKGHSYAPHLHAQVVVQAGADPGWGHGSNSSLDHRGEGGQTDVENASVTFLLLQTEADLSIGDDLDTNDDGHFDSEAVLSGQIYDSVGILDADGLGDIGYGLANFRRSTLPGSRALASGTIIPVNFTASWIGRATNSVGYKATEWQASDVGAGNIPYFSLGDAAHTYPSTLAGAPLNHVGAPNFGAPPIPGVVVLPPPSPLPMSESGETNRYRLGLSLVPTGSVTIEIQSEPGLEVGTDRGITFGGVRRVAFVNNQLQEVWFRTLDNHDVEATVRKVRIHHAVAETKDPRFAAALIPAVELSVRNDDLLLLSEVLVNPVGVDQGREFIELIGPPGALLSDTYLVVVESEGARNLGTARRVISLGGMEVGTNGVLVLASEDPPYQLDPATRVYELPASGEAAGGYLPNEAFSLLLVASRDSLDEGDDLDDGDNGILEGLPKSSWVLDSVGWLGSDPLDHVYAAALVGSGGIPDAATRRVDNRLPNDAAAWYFGDLRDGDAEELRYNRNLSSTNTPPGAVLTPGSLNNSLPRISNLEPICGAIGDPTNPEVEVMLADAETTPDTLRLTAHSDNPSVVPDDRLRLRPMGGGRWILSLDPVGVGYARITLEASDGVLQSRESFEYAASEFGTPRTRYLIGAGDGSTAIPLTGNWMLVGDDENQMIRLYHRDRSELPVARFPMTPFLGLLDIEGGIPREVDIEASTRVGNRIFWLGAHSHANIGEQRVNRGRIFATDLVDAGPATTLTYVGRYDHLKEDLVAWDVANGHGRGANYYGLAASTADGIDPKAADGSGFNLEGLCLAPGSDQVAYVACRAPLAPAHRRTHALLIPVLNFTTLAVSDGPPGSARFGPPIELDLFGRGIRSIEGSGTNYLIVAGPPAAAPSTYPNDFRLYTWDGVPGTAPQLRGASLTGLNVEGIIELPAPPWTPDREVHLLSDNGTRLWYGDDVITKLLPETNFKKCRTDWLSLGPVVIPEPIILGVMPSRESTLIRWRGVVGALYRVQWAESLDARSWQNVIGDIEARDVWAEKRHLAPPASARYYRVVVAP